MTMDSGRGRGCIYEGIGTTGVRKTYWDRGLLGRVRALASWAGRLYPLGCDVLYHVYHVYHEFTNQWFATGCSSNIYADHLQAVRLLQATLTTTIITGILAEGV